MDVEKASEPLSIASNDEDGDDGCSADALYRSAQLSSCEPLRRRFILGHCEGRGNIVEWLDFEKREIACEHFLS